MLLGLLLLITTLSNAANQRKFNKRGNVLILGAGLAGVAAAKELVLNGFNVDIIEAYSEPGGRLKFKLWNDSVIELGANWVHGVGSSRINPILQLLMDSSMDMTVTNFNDFNLYDHYGKIKRDEFKESQERFNDFMNKLKDYAELRRNESLVDMDGTIF